MSEATTTLDYTASFPAPVAQGIERAPPEREVAGSNPAGRIHDPPEEKEGARGGTTGSAARSLQPIVGSARALSAAWRLPRSAAPVQTLQLGCLCSAFGNDGVLLFTLNYRTLPDAVHCTPRALAAGSDSGQAPGLQCRM